MCALLWQIFTDKEHFRLFFFQNFTAEGENNGDNVVQYPLMYGDLLLEWCFKRQPNGYEIRNRLSSKALDATQDGGYNVLTWDYGDNDHQQWYLVPVDSAM